ncbi:CaiB/BaiF CoA transferase family protein [Verticiella alkaliphila]|uniref:CaiB/BaiF CoA transferase family protein n=1 Tax=Verticiella alkaliphila TaxID=2779529 RepID=UPI00209B7DC7|nr:CoA transferase [Verticiella sp. GG226]
MKHGPLAGMKVLELAQIMAGPTCGVMLADLGADVIKVEKLPGGDDTRGYREDTAHRIPPSFAMLNRNKRGIALNLKKPEGVAVLKRMAAQADVLIENYRAGTMDKLGVGYEALRAINPALIYCSISGYGRTGPMADKGGFDLIAQAFGGIMSVTGEPGGAPMKPGNSVADINAGLLAVIGIQAAYVERLRTGQGQYVDTSLFEASLQQMYWFAAIYFATGRSLGGAGSGHPLIAPYQAFRTADQWITIGGANQANWHRIADLLGHPEWREDPRFLAGENRKANEKVLADLIGEILVTQPAAYWLDKLDAVGVPAGPVNTIGQALAHPQAAARDMVVTVDHPSAGPMRALGLPVKLSNLPPGQPTPPPLLGEHTRAVLADYGFTTDEVDDLLACGAVTETSAT